MADKSPVYLALDTRRRIEFNLNAANMIKKHTEPGSSLWEKVSEVLVDGNPKVQYDINGDALQVYLWACLNVGERLDGKPFNLSIEEVGDLINSKRKSTRAYLGIQSLLARYYGDDPGEE